MAEFKQWNFKLLNLDELQTIARTQPTALNQLRFHRAKMLRETDWWAVQDRTMTQAEKDYRQALRDLTTSSTPTLDEVGKLNPASVNWPEPIE